MSHPPQPGPLGGPTPYGGPAPYGAPGGPGPYGGPAPYGAPGGPVGTPYGWTPPVQQRPGPVTAAGIITAVLGGLGILGGIGVGILVALFGALLGQIAEGKAPGEGAAVGVTTTFVAIALAIALVSVVLSGLYLFLGVRVLRRGRVARVVLTVWNGLGAIIAVISAVATVAQSQEIGLAITTLLTAAPALAIVVLLWTGSARAWFDRPEPARPGPAIG